jgi:hypothetical protein
MGQVADTDAAKALAELLERTSEALGLESTSRSSTTARR